MGLVAVLNQLADGGHAGGAQQLRELGQRVLAVVDGGDQKARWRARPVGVPVGTVVRRGSAALLRMLHPAHGSRRRPARPLQLR